ncbi:MAG: lytic murein transglycosylase [Sulfurimonas sp.]|uniref:lytic murein transglycosylase n=1 Tax=Sulfurimonas sp. TaxID=2022749 RepID=UPI0025D24E99|nr:lytic murein transglycosylase [Sulfurimonas sp.]MCK9454767.1 lytic murein transglycosylase [Sulfurimonas sp.]
MSKIIFTLLFSTLLFAKYDNCTFQNRDYTDICNKVVKDGVSYKYANKFLLSYFKTQKFDEVSYKYLQPKYIKTHKKNEKKANNTLVKYVPEMVEHLKKYAEVYDYTEQKFGVNREIIAAILIKETKLGKIKPTHDAFIVFNTLVVRTKPNSPREKWLLNMGKTNMASIITHCYKKGVTPEECNLPSSYAGAVGIPQFMPNSFVYAQGYKTEIADLTKMEDAIVSAGKFLHKKADFTEMIEWSKMPDIVDIESKWYDYEFENDNASLVYQKSKKSNKTYDCFTCNKDELQYLRAYAKKIMRYNNSSNYAIGVIRLAYDAHLGLK